MHAISRRAILVALFATVAAVPTAAVAAPTAPKFGPLIEVSLYEGQSKCDPTAKPGVLAFRQRVLAAYPGTGAGSISRGCHVGGRSEHKEGRAWDWGVNVNNTSQRKAANDLIGWLEAKDKYGNEASMARRAGIMYVIWNRRIWFPGGEWRTYCVQKKKGCFAPGTKTARHPHTDHVHFSFTWKGARKKSSFWTPLKTWITSGAAHPSGQGYWLTAGTGATLAFGAGQYGSKPTAKVAASMAPTPSGKGFWVLGRDGQVRAGGDATFRGAARDQGGRFVSLASAPSGKGYWILAADGRVFAFGSAEFMGDAADDGRTWTAIVRTPSGAGYWLFAENGSVAAFGDAQKHGNAKDMTSVVAGAAASPSGGYWIVGRGGGVRAFGPAQHKGGIAGVKNAGRVVAMSATPTGSGYWIFTRTGKVFALGDAVHRGSL